MEADLDEAQTQLGEATTKLESTEKQLSNVIIYYCMQQPNLSEMDL